MFREHALVHRVTGTRNGNVTDLLPKRYRPQVLVRIRGAWALENADLAKQRLDQLASELGAVGRTPRRCAKGWTTP